MALVRSSSTGLDRRIDRFAISRLTLVSAIMMRRDTDCMFIIILYDITIFNIVSCTSIFYKLLTSFAKRPERDVDLEMKLNDVGLVGTSDENGASK